MNGDHNGAITIILLRLICCFVDNNIIVGTALRVSILSLRWQYEAYSTSLNQGRLLTASNKAKCPSRFAPSSLRKSATWLSVKVSCIRCKNKGSVSHERNLSRRLWFRVAPGRRYTKVLKTATQLKLTKVSELRSHVSLKIFGEF